MTCGPQFSPWLRRLGNDATPHPTSASGACRLLSVVGHCSSVADDRGEKSGPVTVAPPGFSFISPGWGTRLLVLLALAACAPAPELEDNASQALSYAPQSVEALDLLEPALERLNRAAGLELRISDDGVPVGANTEGTGTCGDTAIRGYEYPEDGTRRVLSLSITYSLPQPVGCLALESVVVHEVIHALRSAVLDDPHSVGGVFMAKARSRRIDVSSLDAICEVQSCTTYVPEEE